MRRIDLVGQTYGRLRVLAFSHVAPSGNAAWLCECECGKSRTVLAQDLKNGNTRSCGCLSRELSSARSTRRTHGMTRSREYNSWATAIQRCHDPNATSFRYYGARGVKVCATWRASFEAFFRDMGARPLGASLDRINNEGDYEPGNCRWATPREQARNQRPRRRSAEAA